MFHELRRELINLKEIHSLVKIKAGTEVEGMTFEEIRQMRQISLGIMPLTVKIGGPEARNDIQYMMTIGVDSILAPMVESVYSLKNFVETMREMDKKSQLSLAVNIETITAFENLDKITQSPFFAALEQVTIGRSDLSGSVGLQVDDPEVCGMTAKIVNVAREFGKKVSIGGKVTPANAVQVRDLLKPDYINTRHMVLNCASNSIAADVQACLEWEERFYEYLQEIYPVRNDFYVKRLIATKERTYLKVTA